MRRVELALAGLPARLQLNRVRFAIATVHGSTWHASKLLSALLLAAAVTAGLLLHTRDEWFVYHEDVQFQDLVRLRADELYVASEVEGWNIFWLRPQALRRRLLAHPWIEEAHVAVKLPASLTVHIQEVEPVAIWVTNGGDYWLAPDGATLPIVSQSADQMDHALPQIIDSLQEARSFAPGDDLAIDPQVLASALALDELLPELEGKVRYNRTVGLNFPLPKPAIWVYWGDGLNMEQKLDNLAATREVVRQSEESAQIVDIRFANRPYLR
jgi:hypothetical protein